MIDIGGGIESFIPVASTTPQLKIHTAYCILLL